MPLSLPAHWVGGWVERGKRRCGPEMLSFFTLCSDGSVVQLTECTMQRWSWSVKGKAEIGLPEGSASARLYNCPLGMADKRRD